MVEYSDKRKNFRFPAFDDHSGVKLSTQHERVLFADELDSIPNQHTYNNEITYEERFFAGEEPVPTPELDFGELSMASLPEQQTPLPKTPYVPKKPAPLKRPEYSYQDAAQTERPAEARQSVFKSEHRASLESKLSGEKRNDTHAKTSPLAGKYSGRNYFVPKHIPPSMAPDANDGEQFSKRQLTERMRKPKSSYLILAEKEERPFQHEQIEKKEIIQFDTTTKENETPFIRRDLNQVKRGTPEDVPAITRKRAETKESSEQRSGRLEKSLSGIMAEEIAQPHSNKYFD